MLEIELIGTYFEIGQTYGRFIEKFLSSSTPNEETIECALKCEKGVKKYASGLLEEIQGIAEITSRPYEFLLTEYLIPHSMRECNVFVISGELTKNKLPIFVRHMDWFERDLIYFHKLITHPAGGYRSLTFNFGDIGRCGGINECGLAIAEASIPFYVHKARSGIEPTLAIRWILDNCSNATEAAQYLEEIPHAQASAFLIGDKKGTLFKGECTPEKVDITLFNEFAIVNNFFQSEQMKHLESMPKSDRAYRFHWTIKNWILRHKGIITTKSVKEVCKGHENGICEHLGDGGTIWSWIAQLGTGELELAEGYPCKNNYNQFTL